MKKYAIIGLILTSLLLIFSSCRIHKVLTPQEKHIQGYYEYDHAWDYSITELGSLRCEETGWLMFNPNGTFADLAVQNHYLTLEDSSQLLFVYTYVCHGQWRVNEDGKFLFIEHSQGFVLKEQSVCVLKEGTNSINDVKLKEMSRKIVSNATPLDYWYTFDIERLDNKWFIWSYTSPKTGDKTYWHMHRTSKKMNLDVK